MKIIKWIGKILLFVLFGLLSLAGVLFAMTRPIFPRAGIEIAVPFSLDDPPRDLIPMGETIEHPKPKSPEGHPGIDFQWDHPAEILASHDGTITQIKKVEEDKVFWEITLTNGFYSTVYKELGDFPSDIKLSAKVKKGDLIGHPYQPILPDGSSNHYQLHWEFGYLFRDRLCPMTYFDEASKIAIEQIWDASINQFKKDFPYICSGDYFGKDK